MQRQYIILTICVISTLFLAGCSSVNGGRKASFFEDSWLFPRRSDEVPGVPVPSERLRSIRQLGAAAGKSTPEKAESYVQALATVIHSDQDSLCRAEAVKQIAKFSTPSVVAALEFAGNDPIPFVRVAACYAWTVRANPSEGLNSLNQILLSDSDGDVILAAVRARGACGDPDTARETLGKHLDTDNPALQVAAMKSLKEITKYNCTDLQQWRLWCHNEVEHPADTQPKRISFAEKLNIWK